MSKLFFLKQWICINHTILEMMKLLHLKHRIYFLEQQKNRDAWKFPLPVLFTLR